MATHPWHEYNQPRKAPMRVPDAPRTPLALWHQLGHTVRQSLRVLADHAGEPTPTSAITQVTGTVGSAIGRGLGSALNQGVPGLERVEREAGPCWWRLNQEGIMWVRARVKESGNA